MHQMNCAQSASVPPLREMRQLYELGLSALPREIAAIKKRRSHISRRLTANRGSFGKRWLRAALAVAEADLAEARARQRDLEDALTEIGRQAPETEQPAPKKDRSITPASARQSRASAPTAA